LPKGKRKGAPERIDFLKSTIQKQYDHENWYGQDAAWKKNRILCIAASVELIGMGIHFEPVYNPAT